MWGVSLVFPRCLLIRGVLSQEDDVVKSGGIKYTVTELGTVFILL